MKHTSISQSRSPSHKPIRNTKQNIKYAQYYHNCLIAWVRITTNWLTKVLKRIKQHRVSSEPHDNPNEYFMHKMVRQISLNKFMIKMFLSNRQNHYKQSSSTNYIKHLKYFWWFELGHLKLNLHSRQLQRV